MIHDIKHLEAKLYIEVLRDALDVVVLEDREVQTCDAWANHDIASGIAAKIEALWERGKERGGTGVRRLGVRWRWIAVLVPKGHVGRSGNSEALCLDVVFGMAWIR